MIPRAQPTITFARRAAASLVTAFAVAGFAHLATVLSHFMANGSTTEVLQQVHGYFLPGSLIAFIALAVFAAVGAFRTWYLALPAGAISAIAAALTGTSITVVQSSGVIDAQTAAAIFGTLLSSNLVFVVATIILSVVVGTRVWAAMLGLTVANRELTPRSVALVRPPAANLATGLVTHVRRKKVDTELAETQWDAYVEALSDNGWSVVDVDEAPDLADSVFVEDAVVVFGGTAVIASPGAESRRDETAAVEATVLSLGLTVERIELPGTLDGGDVLKVGSTVYVGRGGRTNADGVRQLRAIVAPLGYTVVAVPVSKVLHLKSAVTALPDGTVIGFPANVDDPAIFDRFLAVPEEAGSHVVVLAADTVLMAASAPKSAALVEGLGYRVVTVDISEFEKLEGCVTCLSVRIR